MNKNYSKLLTGSSYSAVSGFFVRGLQLVRSVIIARYLGPENMGMYAILVNINALSIALADSGNAFALIKMIGQYKNKGEQKLNDIISSAFWHILIATFLITMVLILISEYIAKEIYNEPGLQFFIILASIFLFLPIILLVNSAIFQSFHRLKELAVIGMLNSVIGLIIYFIFVREYGLLGAVISMIIVNFISVLTTVLLFTRKIFLDEKITIHLKIDKQIIKESMKTRGPNISQTAIDVAAPLIAGSILAILLNFENLGYYHVASYFTWVVLSIPLAIATPYYPMINEFFSEKSDQYSSFILKSQKIVCFITFPIALGLGLFSNLIIKGVYGNDYILATNVSYWTSISAFYAAFGTLLGYIFYVQMKGFEVVKIRIIWLVIYIVSAYFLIQYFGIIGAGLGFFIAYTFQSLLFVKMLPENIQFKRWNMAILLLISVVGVCMIFYAWILLDKSILFSSLVILGVLLIEFMFLTNAEKKYFGNKIKVLLNLS